MERAREWICLVMLGAAAAMAGGCQPRIGVHSEDTPETPERAVRALGTTYQVGPSRSYQKLQDVAGLLAPGDVVELDYSPTPYPPAVIFTRSGTDNNANKITIRGIPNGGQRPVIKAGINQPGQANLIHFNLANYYLFENIEIDGSSNQGNGWNGTLGTFRCIFNEAAFITLRNIYLHDCPAHGLLGAEDGSGPLTLEYSELARGGSGDNRHLIYMDTDPVSYPNAVFRMQYNYVHDGNGGYLVKSRAERNEIYYNWIENAYYREMELIGRDSDDPPPRPMNSDVVGNVFNKTVAAAPTANNNIRIGHDWDGTTTAGTHGRYRFVNNTFVLPQGSTSASIVAWSVLESVEMHNNVWYRPNSEPIEVFNTGHAVWKSGSAIIAGQKNWVVSGSSYPTQWTGTLTGTNPGFFGTNDVRLTDTSPLREQGTSTPTSAPGYPFPTPLAFPPASVPPLRIATTIAPVRPTVGTIDIGAYEGLSDDPPPPSCPQVGQGWTNLSFTSQNGTFTADFDATPSVASTDAVVGLSSGAVSDYAGLAANIRFANTPTNHIDARTGSTYTGSVPYSANTSYHFRLVVDVTAHTYSAFVTPAGGSEQTLGTGLAFRTGQGGVTSLNNWAGQVDPAASGTVNVCNFTATPSPVGGGNLIPDPGFESSKGGGGITDKDYFLTNTPAPGESVTRSTVNPLAGAASLRLVMNNQHYAEEHDRTAADLTQTGNLTAKGTIRNNGASSITVQLSVGYFDGGWGPHMTGTSYTLSPGTATNVTQVASIPAGAKTQFAHWIKCTAAGATCDLTWDTAYLGFNPPP